MRRVSCRRCGKVKQERLAFLADNPFSTKRFAFYVGWRWRASPIRDVAKELWLDWHTVKALEQQYMREQLRRVGPPPTPTAPRRDPSPSADKGLSAYPVHSEAYEPVQRGQAHPWGRSESTGQA